MGKVMSTRKMWVFSPDSGGKKIPDPVKHDVEQHINSIAEQHFKGKYTRLDIRLRNTSLHLCRLRYFGDDKWGFAVYTYSNEKYELATYPEGGFFGKPDATRFREINNEPTANLRA